MTIIAIVLFISPGASPVAYRFAEPFPTVAACRAQLTADAAMLEGIRQRAEANLGRPLRMLGRCVVLGVEA